MKKIVMAIIFFLVLSVPAFGSDWKQVGTGPNDNPIYLDVDNILTKNKGTGFGDKLKKSFDHSVLEFERINENK